MKTLSIAISIALIGIVVVFVMLSFVGLDQSVAGSIAAAIVGGIPYVRESLDKHQSSSSRKPGGKVLSYEGFALPLPRLVLYGSLTLFAAMHLASGIAGIVSAMSELADSLRTFLLTVSALVVFPTAFLVGRWVGRRSGSKGLAAVILISVIVRGAASLGDLMLLSHAERAEVFGGMALAEQFAIGIFLFGVVGGWGYWRGRRQRLAAYVSYLLTRVPADTRDAIVDLAFAEASRPN